jgi:uncharacterized protein YbaP (TraB family)
MIYRVKNSEVYIFGSIHYVPEGVTLQLEKHHTIIDRCEEAVFEIDFDNRPAVSHHLLDSGNLAELTGKSLSDRIGLFAKRVGFEGPVDSFKPWILALILPAKFFEISGYSNVGVDTRLWGFAKSKGKKMGALEGAEIYEIFDSIAVPECVRSLTRIVDDPERLLKKLEMFTSVWNGDKDAPVEAEHAADRKLMPSFFQKIFDHRNRLWAPKIIEAINSGRLAAFTFGFGHLLGPTSVKRLLAAKGFQLEQV